MRNLIVTPPLAAAALLASSCGGGGGVATPSVTPARIAGAYRLEVTASNVCRLPVSSFAWDVEASSSGTSRGDSVKVTLPGGNAGLLGDGSGLDMSFFYDEAPAADTLQGYFTTALFGTPVAPNLRFETLAIAKGRVRRAPGGRGEMDGTFDGQITLRVSADSDQLLGQCAAADHRWSLRAR